MTYATAENHGLVMSIQVHDYPLLVRAKSVARTVTYSVAPRLASSYRCNRPASISLYNCTCYGLLLKKQAMYQDSEKLGAFVGHYLGLFCGLSEFPEMTSLAFIGMVHRDHLGKRTLRERRPTMISIYVPSNGEFSPLSFFLSFFFLF